MEKQMNTLYETPELIVVACEEDIIATSGGINLPDVPLNSHREDLEIM